MPALVAASLLATAAIASPAAPGAPEQVRIPFANLGGIRSFHADEDDVVYLQDSRRRWYRAELIGGCQGLPFAYRVGIDGRGGTTFDRFSTLIVDGERCRLNSLTRSEPPQGLRAKNAKKKRARPG